MRYAVRASAILLLAAMVVSTTASLLRAQTATRLRLDEAIDYALAHNPDIVRARAALDSARAESLAARVRPYNPTLEAEFARGGSSVGDGSDRSASIGASQTFEWPGKRGARIAVATAQYRVAEAEVAQEERGVVLDVRRLYRRAAAFGARRSALERAVALDRELADAAQRRVRDAVATPFTARVLTLEASRSDIALLEARAELHAIASQLQATLGSSVATEPVVDASADLLHRPAPPESLLIDQALILRTDLAPVRERVNVALAQESLARRDGRPDPTVGIAIESSRDVIDGSDIMGDPAITGGIQSIADRSTQLRARISVPLPLFNHNQAGRARAAAAVTLARADIVRQEAQIRSQVRAAAVRDADAQALLALSERASASAAGDLNLVRAAYREGRISLEEYLTDKARLLDAVERSLTAADRAAHARSELEEAVGAPLDDIPGGSAR